MGKKEDTDQAVAEPNPILSFFPELMGLTAGRESAYVLEI